jgi:hypothetical protein
MGTDTPPNPPTPDGTTTSDPTSGAGDGFKPITTQAELDARLSERLQRERAKFADYAELKAKAEQLEAANKSELEKATDRATKAEKAAVDAAAEALRLRVAVQHGITLEDADLFLTGTDEETLTKQAKRLTERVTPGARPTNHVPREGTTPTTPPADDMRAFVRGLFAKAAD